MATPLPVLSRMYFLCVFAPKVFAKVTPAEAATSTNEMGRSDATARQSTETRVAMQTIGDFIVAWIAHATACRYIISQPALELLLLRRLPMLFHPAGQVLARA